MLSVAVLRSVSRSNLRCSLKLSQHILLPNNEQGPSSNQATRAGRPINPNHLNSIGQIRCFSWQEASNTVVSSIVNSSSVDLVQKTLINLHEWSGLPWCLGIALASVVTRTALLPLLSYEKYMTHLSETKAMPEIKANNEKIQELTRRKLQLRELKTEQGADRFYKTKQRQFRRQIIEKYNIHPFKRVICLLSQFPVWVVLSFSIGSLCSSPAHERFLTNPSIINNVIITRSQVHNEGCLWFPDLTLSDPYCILPLLFAITLFCSIEYNILIRRFNYIESSRILNAITIATRCASVLLVYVSTGVPSGLVLYWTCNALTGFIQNVIVLDPKVRKILYIKDTIHSRYQPDLKDFGGHLKGRVTSVTKIFKKSKSNDV